MRASFRIAILALLALPLAGCDSGDGPTLALGAFEATATGAIAGALQGEATFAAPADSLVLDLSTGTFRPLGRPCTLETGLFFRALWNQRPGTLRLGSGSSAAGWLFLPSERTFGLFPSPFTVESGTLTVEAVAGGRVEGAFELIAVEAHPPAPDGARLEAHVRGTFIAAPAAPPSAAAP